MKYKFIGFDGHYGGDEYERLFCKKLSGLSKNISLRRITAERKGGFKSLIGLFKLILSAFIFKGRTIRPLGIPIIKYKMTVILHHFDQKGSPFYTKLLERIDFFLLKLFSRLFKIKFITVSNYWSEWVKINFKSDSYIIYNEVKVNFDNLKDRDYLSIKYNLKQDSSWVFLGSNQLKKGGKFVIDYLNENHEDIFDNIILIQSGVKKDSDSRSSVVIWIDEEDYFSFIKSCELVVANSEFKEGWCRVLHEAALLNVPIVGSGSGGMGELLELVNGKSTYTLKEISDCICIKELKSKSDVGSNKLNNLNLISHTNLLNWINGNN